jgi:hypothetical protein
VKNDDVDIELKCIRDRKCDDCILKETNLEKYVRMKLGQDFKNPKSDKFGRIEHERFDFSACNYEDENINIRIYKNNKKICDIFENDFYSYRIVTYSWKGCMVEYIINLCDYNKYDYWDEKVWCDGYCGELKYPYLFKKRYSGEGTVGILVDLINVSKKIYKCFVNNIYPIDLTVEYN